ncbi:MAG: PEP-CTERM sorting domain-containing protein [Desulfobulbaceae bacterium]|nr:PEP-CTERM sorting domain-containing protein [Desulfobulbaceae bacterium]
MTKKLNTPISLFATVAFGFILTQPAQATHIHFEDLYADDIQFSQGTSYTWTFNLNEDDMNLWKLADSEVHTLGEDFLLDDESYMGTGQMTPDDILHYAYLTFAFTDVMGGSGAGSDKETEEMTLLFDLDSTDEYNANFKDPDGTSTFSWDGVSIEAELIGDGANHINVWSYLEDDHLLKVELTAVEGSFGVDWTNLSGCYDVAPDPIPEPATMLLFGTGLAGIAGFSRKKLRI